MLRWGATRARHLGARSPGGGAGAQGKELRIDFPAAGLGFGGAGRSRET